jgi:hypothetical protein
MAHSVRDWEIVRAFFERGLSLSEIVEREEVPIKSKSQISKTAAKEGWIKDEKKQIFEKEIKARQDLKEVAVKKETLKETERFINDIMVSERLKFETTSNARMELVAQKAMEMLDMSERAGDVKSVMDTLKVHREARLGKSPEVAVQINNNVPASTHIPDDPLAASTAYRKMIG